MGSLKAVEKLPEHICVLLHFSKVGRASLPAFENSSIIQRQIEYLA